MRMTLEYMVKDIHNDLDFDEINTIDDTPEAAQVAQIIRTTYYSMMSSDNWPHLRKTIKLVPYSATSQPTHMSLPKGVTQLCNIFYNCATEGETRLHYKEIKYLDPDAFLRKSNSLNSDASNVKVIKDDTGVVLMIRTDLAPTYFTSFDDNTVVFDSYDSSVDEAMMSSKVQAMAYVMPAWETRGDFIPDLPDEAFIGLLEEAKSRAALKLRQMPDEKAEMDAQRQARRMSRKNWKVAGGIKKPNYGRRGKKA